MTRVAFAWTVALAVACSSPKTFCSGPTRFDYDPTAPGADLTLFPDEFYSQNDATTRTGLRLKVDLDDAPWLQALPPIQQGAYEALDSLDGFGTSAGIVVRFSGPLGKVPSGEAESLASKAVLLVELAAEGPKRVPFEAQATDDGAGMILWPMRPLAPMTKHALVVTNGLEDANGRCIAPSPAMRALLSNRDVPAPLARLEPDVARALEALHLAPEDVTAAAVFTTESLFDDTLAVAKDVARTPYSWTEAPTCDAPTGAFRRCRGLFSAKDYRHDGVVDLSRPPTWYALPVALWEPTTPGPWPVLIFGHGLGASKEQAEVVARVVAPLGVATVAIDAPEHGEHPTASGQGGNLAMFQFFGIDATGGLDALVMRDHFREATYDKLQLLELLRATPGLDTTRLSYVGYSLGGMMGSELVASASGFGLAALFVPGARISTIASKSASFSLLADALATPEDPGSADRFFAVLQADLERGDPVNWAPHVLANRFGDSGASGPDLFVGEVVDDGTMPNVATETLARALGVPEMPPVIRPIDGVTPLASAPVSANLGDLTAALFQFDRITTSPNAAPIAAMHQNILEGRESQALLGHFVESWLEGGKAELENPYATLGTPELGK